MTAATTRSTTETSRSPKPAATPATPQQQAFVALIRTADRVMAEYMHLFRKHAVTEPQYNVLRILRGAGPSGLPCQEIGKRMIARVPDITRLLDRLERGGLVSRERDDRDRRVVTTRLSPRGRALLRKLDRPVHEMHQRQFGHFRDSELRQLTAILGRLESRIEERNLVTERSSS